MFIHLYIAAMSIYKKGANLGAIIIRGRKEEEGWGNGASKILKHLKLSNKSTSNHKIEITDLIEQNMLLLIHITLQN